MLLYVYRYNVERTEPISGFLFTFITQKLQKHLVGTINFPNTFLNFFHDYDVKTLEIIHPMTFRKYTKHPITVL